MCRPSPPLHIPACLPVLSNMLCVLLTDHMDFLTPLLDCKFHSGKDLELFVHWHIANAESRA